MQKTYPRIPTPPTATGDIVTDGAALVRYLLAGGACVACTTAQLELTDYHLRGVIIAREMHDGARETLQALMREVRAWIAMRARTAAPVAPVPAPIAAPVARPNLGPMAPREPVPVAPAPSGDRIIRF